MNNATLKRTRELFYYGLLALTLLLCLVAVATAILPGITKEKYVSAALSPSKPGRVTISGKSGEDLAPGTLNSIFKQAGFAGQHMKEVH